VRDLAATDLGDGWSHTRFQANQNRVAQHLEAGQLREALAGAQQLLQQAQAAGGHAYFGANHDLALAYKVMTDVLQGTGEALQGLSMAQEAGRLYEEIAKDNPGTVAENMAAGCLGQQGQFLCQLGRYDAAAAAFEEAIRRLEKLGDQHSMGVGKFQLAGVRLSQNRWDDALEAYKDARETFSRLNDSGTVAMAWNAIGVVHQQTGQVDAAEEAYNQSLAISIRLDNQVMQAAALHQLGSLYHNDFQRLEDAASLFQRARGIFCEIGDLLHEGTVNISLAITLGKLQRFEEAKQAIRRSIECREPFGHAAQPWTTWDILADIETADGNSAAAAGARHQALDTFLAYRRDGGENHSRSGRLALAVRQALASGDPAEAASLLQQLADDPDFANQLPFLTALQAITAGSRDRSLAENPYLEYRQAAEVLLLIEALEAEAGAGG
jgi:tetratricopeptide (TPR) repeat protein